MLCSRPIVLLSAGLATTTQTRSLNVLLPARPFTLVTLDVDGTLVSGSGWAESAHGRAYSRAVGRILGGGGGSGDGDDDDGGVGSGIGSSSGPVAVPPVPDALRTHEYHGSTDGLILLRLARAALGIQPADSAARLDDLMDDMYGYIATLTDEEVGRGLTVLPGVIETLTALSTMKDGVACGLVTGNVEGIARRKMSAVGILATDALSPPSRGQVLRRAWPGAESIGFLGGFGSDYCSGDIDDADRNYLDRGEQIAIAVERCRELLHEEEDLFGGVEGGERKLSRVVHVGDAPADVLAARSYSEKLLVDEDGNEGELCVGMVAVATGSYAADELRECMGEPVPGRWEPVVLEQGLADPQAFLEACGLL